MLFGLVDFVIIILGTFMPGRFGALSDPAVVHTMRAANSLRILRTCQLFKGRWDWKGGGTVPGLDVVVRSASQSMTAHFT